MYRHRHDHNDHYHEWYPKRDRILDWQPLGCLSTGPGEDYVAKFWWWWWSPWPPWPSSSSTSSSSSSPWGQCTCKPLCHWRTPRWHSIWGTNIVIIITIGIGVIIITVIRISTVFISIIIITIIIIIISIVFINIIINITSIIIFITTKRSSTSYRCHHDHYLIMASKVHSTLSLMIENDSDAITDGDDVFLNIVSLDNKCGIRPYWCLSIYMGGHSPLCK